MAEEKKLDLAVMNREISDQLKDAAVSRALLATTFKGLDETNMRKAIMEGMIRGFTFKNFLQKDIYALPFGGGYSLVQAIDYNRKIGMRSGIVGKDAPVYAMTPDGKIDSCTVTVKRMVGGYVGDFTATVFFDEYYKPGRPGKPSQWDIRPKTMIAKVAEMHALRMACPEELGHAYVEEEMDKEVDMVNEEVVRVDDALDTKKDLTMGSFKKKNEKAKKEEPKVIDIAGSDNPEDIDYGPDE